MCNLKTQSKNLSISEKMVLSIQIFLLFLGSAIGGNPSSESSQEFIDRSKWALTQVFIYYTEEFDQLAIPDCHGTLLTDKHVLCLDHVNLTGRQMTNLVLNFKCLLLLSFLTAAEF